MNTIKWKKTSNTDWESNNGYQIKTKTGRSLLGQYKFYELYEDGEKIDEYGYLKLAKEEAEYRSSGLSYIDWLRSQNTK